jgi:radical SAM protein (TIGR01212 family)
MQLYPNGIPYYSIGQYYKERFGERVYKLSVTVSDDCPNRRGLKGMETCIFCDPWGSAAYTFTKSLELKDQIGKVREHLLSKRASRKTQKFLVYFQAYTSTFTSVKKLRAHIEASIQFPDIVGFVLGTRPDCLSPAVFDLINEYKDRYYFSVELGVQTFFDDQLEFIKRGHNAEQSINAIKKVAAATNVDVGIHLMFGMPNETNEQMIETAKIIRDLPVHNVKLHNMHVLTRTPLETLYNQGLFAPIELDDYTDRVLTFLSHLKPTIPVQRLSAVSSRWDELVAPTWTRHKMKTHQHIVDAMKHQDIYQGKYAN